MRNRLLATVALTALVLGGCSALSAPIAPSLREPAPPGVPAATQTNVSPYTDLSRLGAWNGTTFVPVNPGSVTGGNVVVMTHGWAAGLLPTYESVQSSSPGLVTMWDPALVDPKTGAQAASAFADLARSLAAADPSSTVLMFSWVDQSSTASSALAAFAPERATEVNGNRMAVAIEQALAPSFATNGGRLHLIGHSFGANVATTAAVALSTILPNLPRQLTLFDSPEVELAKIGGAKNDLRYKLPKLTIGRTPGTTFVDNYVSLVGESYSSYPGLGQVVDVRLAPPSSDSGVEKHEYPIGWYAASAAAPSSDVGLWWSPLVGADDTALASSWQQTSSDPAAQLELRATGPIPASSGGSQLPTTTTAVSSSLSVNGSMTVQSIPITTTADSLWLDFDAELSGAATDTFHLFIDGRERSTMIAPPTGSGDRSGRRSVILYDLESGEHTVSLTAEGAAEGSAPSSGASARLTNLTITSTPDIQRNNTPQRTERLIVWILVVVVLVIVLVIAALVFAIYRVVHHFRRRRTARPGAPSDH